MDESHKLQLIASLHTKVDAGSGMTSGFCSECDYEWPCPTAHIANGWGEIHDCWDESWCHHAGVKLRNPNADLRDLRELELEDDDGS